MKFKNYGPGILLPGFIKEKRQKIVFFQFFLQTAPREDVSDGGKCL